MEPQQFCDTPLIPKIAIQDIQPFSVVVSWHNQQNFGLIGYEVLYHELDGEGKEVSFYVDYLEVVGLCCTTKYIIFLDGFLFVWNEVILNEYLA